LSAFGAKRKSGEAASCFGPLLMTRPDIGPLAGQQ